MSGLFTARRSSVLVIFSAALMLFAGNASAAPEGTVAHSLQLATVDISVTSGSIDYGPAVLRSCVTTGVFTTIFPIGTSCFGGTTQVSGQVQNVLNNGSPVVLSIRYQQVGPGLWGANCDGNASTVEWTPSQSAAGLNVFRMEAQIDLQPGGGTTIADNGSPSTISATIPTGESHPLTFRLHMPTASNYPGPCSVTTTIVGTLGS